eukprot:m.197612 g.197612  ORF g.197612 m.197612 type:complete len:703 (+) comp32663_c2_seq1:240-2348(+)
MIQQKQTMTMAAMLCSRMVFIAVLATACSQPTSDSLPCVSLSPQCMQTFLSFKSIGSAVAHFTTADVARYSTCETSKGNVCVLDTALNGAPAVSSTMCFPENITECLPEANYMLSAIGSLSTPEATQAYFDRCGLSNLTIHIPFSNKTMDSKEIEVYVIILATTLPGIIKDIFKTSDVAWDWHCGDHPTTLFESPGAVIMIGITLFLGLLGIGSEVFEGSLDLFSNDDDDGQDVTKPNGDMSAINAVYEDAASLLNPTTIEKKLRRVGVRKFLYMFNPTNNISKLLTSSPKRNLRGLDGLRAFSMLWIILAHTTLLTNNKGYEDPAEVLKFIVSPSNQFISGANLGVDTFFFIAGVLTSYTSINGLRKHKIAVHLIPKQIGFYTLLRWLRIVPVYMYLLFAFAEITPVMGSGPFWFHMYEDVDFCRKYWWTNFLFINNFVPENFYNQCMSWSWYLAVYMQFSVVALIILYIYVRSAMGGKILTLVLTFGLTILSYCLIANDAFDSAKFQNSYYDKPYTRAPALTLGIYLGMILRDTPPSKLKLSPKVAFCVRHVAVGVLLFIIYVFDSMFNAQSAQEGKAKKEWSSHELAAYYTFGRLAFCGCIGALTFLCSVGGGGIYSKFLNLSFWEPLGKLTFGAYLVHPSFIRVYTFSQPYYTYVHPYELTINFLGIAVVSYAFAVLTYILIELPFETMLMGLKGKKK